MAMNPNLFAGLGPFAGLTQASTEALSRGIGGLFGIKDPEMEAQRAIAMAAQNPNDPATLSSAANILAQAGKIDQAMALAGQARQITRQEQQFGLEQRRVTLAEQQAEANILNQAEKLALDKETLELKKKEISQRADLNELEKKRINAQIDSLQRADYYITEQKGEGGITEGFIAINKRNANDRVTIPLTTKTDGGGGNGVVTPQTPTATGPKPSLDSFFTGSTGVAP